MNRSGTPAGAAGGHAAAQTPAMNPVFTHTSPTPSPRRAHFGNVSNTATSTPRTGRVASPLQPGTGIDFPSGSTAHVGSPSRRSINLVMGFSPGSTTSGLPPVSESSSSHFSPGSPSRLPLTLNVNALARLSPQITTPVEQTFHYAEGSPKPRNSPRARHGDLPRSRRNSAAIVSISLSSRSRSRTPRGSQSNLPGQGSGSATPNKGSSTVTPKGDGSGPGKPSREVLIQMGPSPQRQHSGSWADDPELDEWQPAGGMLLDDGDNDYAIEQDDDEDRGYDDDGRVWSGISDASEPTVEDVLKPGMVFGEGLEFQGELIVPAIGREGTDNDGLPLRRGGSEVGKALRAGIAVEKAEPSKKKVFEVIRKLGSGSYAVVYLVREKGGRRREYALKCLSKQNLEEEQIETQLFEAHIHLSLPIHTNIVTLHQTLQTEKWLFLMLELCPGEDLFYWLEKSRDASPPPAHAHLVEEPSHPMSSSKFSSSSIPFSSSAMFTGLANHMPMSMSMSSSFSNSPNNHFSPGAGYGASPASLLFAHHNGHHANHNHHTYQHLSQTPPTPSLLSTFSANTLLSPRRLRLIASMFAQMCEAVAVCHEAGVSHRDIKPENFICCDSVELESVQENADDDGEGGFGPQAKRKVVVKLTDFGLATTEEESGDVECGSRPYMSYECRNNLGPTYYPAPADVWSLGIVLINMLFHRNPWKDPCPGDVNFDRFLDDPTSFLLAKFTGIGREVAHFLATHVLCVDVGDRVGAREFGKWVKGLPEMIGGRKAVKDLRRTNAEHKMALANGSLDKGMFVKSPVQPQETFRKTSASGLTSSAPILALDNSPRLSSLPHPSQLAQPMQFELGAPLTPELDADDPNTASTVEDHDQPTPTDKSENASPCGEVEPDLDQSEVTSPSLTEIASPVSDSDSRSLSTTKRRKRGVRKGKAAQAALAAAAAAKDGESPSQAERDALLAELANASQSLARDLSKASNKHETQPPDSSNAEHFPPLGTTPAQMAAAKKSKWKEMMKFSSTSGNPELAALARRVAERDAGSAGNWSAPAKLQDDKKLAFLTGGVSSKPAVKQTATMSSGVSSALSSFGQVSSATSSSAADEDDDWRHGKDRTIIQTLPSPAQTKADPTRANKVGDDRAKKAALAAAALTGSMDPMGAFGKSAMGGGVPRHGPLHGRNLANGSGGAIAASRPPQVPVHGFHKPVAQGFAQPSATYQPPASLLSLQPRPTMTSKQIIASGATGNRDHPGSKFSSLASTNHSAALPSLTHSTTTTTSMTIVDPAVAPTRPEVEIAVSSDPPEPMVAASPNKPKLKGQIQSLAKMLSGLKTKGGKE